VLDTPVKFVRRRVACRHGAHPTAAFALDLRQVQPPWPADGTLARKADLDTVLPVHALRSPG